MTKQSNSDQLLSHKRRVSIATISLVFGFIVFVFAYVGMKQQIGLGSYNYPILTWMIDHRTYAVTDMAKIITSIASPYVLAVIVGVTVIAFVIIKREIWRPIVIACSVAVAAATSTLLKLHFMDVRPPKIDMIPTFEYDFSFPSGHTISMAVFLLVVGYLIYSRKFSVERFWAWITIAVFGTGLIALSRLYLGYHWFTDVVASIGLAFIILAIVIVVDTIFIRRYKA